MKKLTVHVSSNIYSLFRSYCIAMKVTPEEYLCTHVLRKAQVQMNIAANVRHFESIRHPERGQNGQPTALEARITERAASNQEGRKRTRPRRKARRKD